MNAVQSQNIKVGIFVIGLSLTVLVSVFILGGSSDILEGRYTLNGKWEDVAGLKEGAVVRLAGWDVGEVKSIKFADELEQRELTVQMRILNRYQDRIRSDSEARIDTVGVLGDKYVSISMGTPSADGLADKSFIGTQAALDFLGYTNKFEDILKNTSNITKKVDLMLGSEDDAGDAQLGKSMAHIEKLLANIREGRGLLNAVVHDEEMAGRFRSVMRNLDQSSGGLAGVMDEDDAAAAASSQQAATPSTHAQVRTGKEGGEYREVSMDFGSLVESLMPFTQGAEECDLDNVKLPELRVVTVTDEAKAKAAAAAAARDSSTAPPSRQMSPCPELPSCREASTCRRAGDAPRQTRRPCPGARRPPCPAIEPLEDCPRFPRQSGPRPCDLQ